MMWGVDSSQPPSESEIGLMFPGDWQFVCGYIGGHTPRVWTREEWTRVFKAGLEILPIWVAPLVDDAGWQAGVTDGNACLANMQTAGLTGMVALDVENGLVPKGYAGGFVSACIVGNLGVTLYGNEATIEGLTGIDWAQWWLAAWTPLRPPPAAAPPDFSMWQLQSSARWDINVCVDSFTFAGFVS